MRRAAIRRLAETIGTFLNVIGLALGIIYMRSHPNVALYILVGSIFIYAAIRLLVGIDEFRYRAASYPQKPVPGPEGWDPTKYLAETTFREKETRR